MPSEIKGLIIYLLIGLIIAIFCYLIVDENLKEGERKPGIDYWILTPIVWPFALIASIVMTIKQGEQNDKNE